MSIEQVERLRAMLLLRRGETVSVEQRRARFEAQWTAAPLPPDATFTPVAIPGTPGGLWVDVDGADPERAVLWLHGGAFMVGSSASYRDFGVRIARASNARVLLLDYRLAPEHPFPAALDDSIAALSWLIDQFPAPGQTAIGGDSCGGNLALAAVQHVVASGSAPPAAMWLISPYLDLTHSGGSIAARGARDPFIDTAGMPQTAAQYLGGAGADDPRASPLFGSLAGLPPTLIQVGSDEVLRDDAWRLAARMGDGAVFQEWAGMIHDWPFFAAMIEEGGWAIAQGGTHLQAHLV